MRNAFPALRMAVVAAVVSLIVTVVFTLALMFSGGETTYAVPTPKAEAVNAMSGARSGFRKASLTSPAWTT